MPYSGGLFDDLARKVMGLVAPQTVLDIGAGAGRYGKMARECCPAVRLTAVECEQEYVDRFGLRAVYDEVRPCPASWLLSEVDASWDMAILGDVLEHMRKSEGLDLLHFLVYRTRYIWAVWPERYVQGSYNGHASEAHISVWTLSDIAGLGADYQVYHRAPLWAAIVRGYLEREGPIWEGLEA